MDGYASDLLSDWYGRADVLGLLALAFLIVCPMAVLTAYRRAEAKERASKPGAAPERLSWANIKSRTEPLAIAIASLSLVLAGWFTFMSFVLWYVRCEESCAQEGSGEPWKEIGESPGWNEQFLLATGVLVAVCLALYCAVNRRRAWTAALLVASVVPFAVWSQLMSTADDPTSQDPAQFERAQPPQPPVRVRQPSDSKYKRVTRDPGTGSHTVHFIAEGPRSTHLAQAKKCVRRFAKDGGAASCTAYPSAEALRFSISPPPGLASRSCWSARSYTNIHGEAGSELAIPKQDTIQRCPGTERPVTELLAESLLSRLYREYTKPSDTYKKPGNSACGPETRAAYGCRLYVRDSKHGIEFLVDWRVIARGRRCWKAHATNAIRAPESPIYRRYLKSPSSVIPVSSLRGCLLEKNRFLR